MSLDLFCFLQQMLLGIIDGVTKAVIDIFKGLWDLIVALTTDPLGFFKGIGNAVLHPVDTFNFMWGAVETAWERDVVNGDARSRGEFFSYALVSIVGLKGLDKVGKVGKLNKVGKGGSRVNGNTSLTSASKVQTPNSLIPIPFNVFQTAKLKELVKHNVVSAFRNGSQWTKDFFKNGIVQKALKQGVVAINNAKTLRKIRNVVNPTTFNSFFKNTFNDVIKSPLVKTKVAIDQQLKKVVEGIGKVEVPTRVRIKSLDAFYGMMIPVVDLGITTMKDVVQRISGNKSDKATTFITKGTGNRRAEVPPAFKQNEFASSYKERLNQTSAPENPKVGFEGARGESLCFLKPPPDPQLKKIFDEAGIDGIEYKNGVPDFSSVAKAQVEINYMLGGKSTYGGKARRANFIQSDQKLADQLNNSPELSRQFGMESGRISAKDIKKYRDTNNLTWHELNDVKTMQLVPTKINGEFGHLGGVGEINAGAFGPGGFANKQREEIIK